MTERYPDGKSGSSTDYYQISMAYAYWKQYYGKQQTEQQTEQLTEQQTKEPTASFELYFRKNPLKGEYAVSCGLQDAIQYLNSFGFDEKTLTFLANERDIKGDPAYSEEFLDYLRNLKFTCSVEAMPNGTVVFANEPLMRITGPIIQTQIIESHLLNIMNFQTLIATNAARIKHACAGRPFIEMGLRRAQELGALSACYAAYVGGSDATSNLAAAVEYGIPVKGTFAHAYVMSAPDEATAFRRYAEYIPGNCTFLVDTYDTIEGVKNAIEVGRTLSARGYDQWAIRLDSGDLAKLSIEARKLLDEAGFTQDKVKIVASNDLNEKIINDLIAQGSKIDIFGVGTNLITSQDQPALGGVYKLVKLFENGAWIDKIKLANIEKTTTPGMHNVRRYYEHKTDADGNETKVMFADAIYDIQSSARNQDRLKIKLDETSIVDLPENISSEDLLVPIYVNGHQVYEQPSATKCKENANNNLQRLSSDVKRSLNPTPYKSGLEKGLYQRKINLITDMKEEIATKKARTSLTKVSMFTQPNTTSSSEVAVTGSKKRKLEV